MKIITKNDFLDFEVPVFMTENVAQKFKNGMKEIFGYDVEFISVEENKKKLNGVIRKSKKFSKEDYFLLAKAELDNNEVGEKLNKSEFAIRMKRGNWLIELQNWARQHGKSDLTEEDVNEFLGELK